MHNIELLAIRHQKTNGMAVLASKNINLIERFALIQSANCSHPNIKKTL
ncbi:TPA: hypothetical protein ACTUT5_002768 [Legionella anisa]|nr:hypothetical protein [Legionella anisa]MBN5936981.1 hypothetical protein [Legionella anisa]